MDYRVATLSKLYSTVSGIINSLCLFSNRYHKFNMPILTIWSIYGWIFGRTEIGLTYPNVEKLCFNKTPLNYSIW